jgi:hypothetical protein
MPNATDRIKTLGQNRELRINHPPALWFELTDFQAGTLRPHRRNFLDNGP